MRTIRQIVAPVVSLVLAALLALPPSSAQEPGAKGKPAEEAVTGSADAAPAEEAAVSTAPDALAKGKAGEMGWTGILSEEQFKALHELRQDAPPALHGTSVELAGGKAYLSLPQGKAPFPAVVVIQEWWGLNDHIRHWADRLSAAGYAALAVDLYDGVVASTSDEAMAAMQNVKEERAHEILAAARDFLREDERVRARKLGTVGWCFGGGWSLNCALAWPDLDACVIYYGRLVTDPEKIGAIGASVCGIFGSRDQGIPPDAVDGFESALSDAGVPHEIWRFDADHAFANPSSARYDELAATSAWNRTRAFLARELKAE